MALDTIEDIIARNKIPILVGGTGLYFRALVSGMADAPSRDQKLRERLKSIVEKKGIEYLYRILLKMDKERAKSISPNDKVRIIRALELRILTKKKFSEIIKHNQNIPENYSIYKICLNYPREILYNRIEQRVDKMVQNGLIEEVRALYETSKLQGPLSKAIGIKELIPSFTSGKSYEEAINEVKQHTRNLAKRQMTWFKKEIGLKWLLMIDEYEKEKVRYEILLWVRRGYDE